MPRSYATAIRLNQRQRNLDEALEYVEYELEKSGLLVKELKLETSYNSNISSYGKFKDDTWIFENHLSSTYIYFQFHELKNIAFNDSEIKDIKPNKNNTCLFDTIKCWIGEKILEHFFRYKDAGINKISIVTLRKTFTNFVRFVSKTNFFESSFLNKEKGNSLLDFFDSIEYDAPKKSLTFLLLDFFEYSADKVPEELDFVLSEYAKEIAIIDSSLSSASLSRDLPSGKDFFYFSFYLNKFFNNAESDKLLKMYYMPVLLWWEITSIIPMRPTEFCVGLKRDSLVVEDDKYYLKIARIKDKPSSKKNRLPLLKRIIITEKIYLLIKEYISITEKYGYTQTLLSYPALEHFRGRLKDVYKRKFEIMPTQRKIDETIFSNMIFNKILYSFQKIVIKEYFSDTFINKFLLPGDTRHLAFTSMMLQGYSPVEIAITGGHRTLHSLNNYISSTNTYIDMETVSLSNNIFATSATKNRLIDTILNKPQHCPISIDNCIPAIIDDLEIGYCTANHKLGYQCEDDDCFNCSKWWCAPTKENFLLIKGIINKRIENEESKLDRDVKFLLSLMNDSGVSFVKNTPVLSNDYKESTQLVSAKIKATAGNVISLKKILSED